jgi:myo-inositol 2-dehydrogenase / D-chiro-inositol 1-dehydrogenase
MARPQAVRLVVAGLGQMGQRHVANAVASPRIELVAVADPDEARTSAVSAKTGAAAYADVAPMLRDTEPDGLIVVTPSATHGPLIELAAQHGVHVLCEKPLAHDGAAALAAVAAAEQAGIRLQVGFQMRFDRDFADVARRVHAGEPGRLYQFRASLRDAKPHARAYLETSGGFFWDGGIHLYDLARWLMGEVTEVSAFGAALSDAMFDELGDVDNAMTVLRFGSGALGFVENSRVAGYGFETGIEVLGAAATYRVPGGLAGGVDVYVPGRIQRPHVVDFLERFEPAYARELEAFVDAIVEDAPVPVDGRDGLAAMRICEAAAASHRDGHTVPIASVPW